MKDIILDIINYTSGSGFFDCIKIAGTEDKTAISAMDGNQTLVLNAYLKEAHPDFIGTFGLGDLSYLKMLANFEPFRADGVEILIEHKERNGEKIPEMIKYSSKDGAKASFRLMFESMIPKVPVFVGIDWDLDFVPRKEKISEFAQLAAMHSDMETEFLAKTVDGNLVFYIGEEGAASHKAQFVFEKDVSGSLNSMVRWPIQQVLQTLKLSNTGNSKVKITKKGVMCVSIDSGLTYYDFFILPNQK